MKVGALACDPGGASGVAWGIFDPKASGGIDEALLGKMNSGSATVTGTEREQIREISQLWQAFYRACVTDARLPPDRVFLVFEDFIYAGGVNYSGDSAKISTSIIWGVEGYRMGCADEFARHRRGQVAMPPLYLQTAGQAKGYAKNQRLKDWGLWVVGREHERSAWQHIAYWLAQYMRHNP